MTDRDKLKKAAEDVHAIASELNRVADEISNPLVVYSSDVSYAYAALYHLRTDLGRIVATLGVGFPGKQKDLRTRPRYDRLYPNT